MNNILARAVWDFVSPALWRVLLGEMYFRVGEGWHKLSSRHDEIVSTGAKKLQAFEIVGNLCMIFFAYNMSGACGLEPYISG